MVVSVGGKIRIVRPLIGHGSIQIRLGNWHDWLCKPVVYAVRRRLRDNNQKPFQGFAIMAIASEKSPQSLTLKPALQLAVLANHQGACDKMMTI